MIFRYFQCLHLIIVIRSRMIVWKHRPYYWYFCLNINNLRWSYRGYIKTAKNGNFCEELLRKNVFEAVLTTFFCYDVSAKASEAVQKIATNQKEYRKCCSCVIICWISNIYLSVKITVKKGCFLGHTPPT